MLRLMLRLRGIVVNIAVVDLVQNWTAAVAAVVVVDGFDQFVDSARIIVSQAVADIDVVGIVDNFVVGIVLVGIVVAVAAAVDVVVVVVADDDIVAAVIVIVIVIVIAAAAVVVVVVDDFVHDFVGTMVE
ncbi:hypothetical protein WICMUC_002703 [Wickerhamomyces mucosus]|uniref:Uncharacterized protein n=1 Tax=Wickerhamomyces mucosus TaxID=1378264 RepID=A0A9P8TEC2_9ASCO|nr:hypothetical protein WICMUC_002703 [Wickerhamomyces mucosus]